MNNKKILIFIYFFVITILEYLFNDLKFNFRKEDQNVESS